VRPLRAGGGCLALAAAVAVIGSVATAGRQPAAAAPRTMAVTVDDLPFVDPAGRHDLADADAATTAIIGALGAASAPAVGFVNEDKLDAPGGRAARIELLRRWVAGGHLLGNHTWSHPDLNRLTAAAFLADVDRGARVWPTLQADAAPRFFRHPMTHTGDIAEKRNAVLAGLAARGYAVAPHTIENADYAFNVGFARARRQRDAALQARIVDAYLAHTAAVTAFAERKAAEIFGRDDVPQTLLIHANALQAEALPALLTAMTARGYRFVPLAAAMGDPAYQSPDTLVTRFGPSWLFRWARSLGRPTSFSGDPEPPAWITDLAAQGATSSGAVLR